MYISLGRPLTEASRVHQEVYLPDNRVQRHPAVGVRGDFSTGGGGGRRPTKDKQMFKRCNTSNIQSRQAVQKIYNANNIFSTMLRAEHRATVQEVAGLRTVGLRECR